MRCVKCGKTTSSVKCESCGFEHGCGSIYFLTQPDLNDIQIQRQPINKGVSEQIVNIAEQYNLGKAFFQAEDYEQAERWLLSPAQKGNTDAQRLLAYLYEVSDAQRNADQAFFWYEQAAARGEKHAIDALIRLYKAAGSSKRDTLRYWEEKKQKMEQDAITLELRRQREVKSSKDFKIKDGILFEYTGTETHVAVPSGIVVISEDAFRENEYIQSITLPEGVNKIGAYAFAECPELRSVSLSKSIREIGDGAFFESPIEAIDLPGGLTSFGEGAFDGTDIRTVTVPGGVKIIPNQAFSGCYYLKEVVLKDGITIIEDEAFEHCPNLETIHIPDSVVQISNGSKHCNPAFYKCDKLSKVIASDAWKKAHSDLLQAILPIRQEDIQWCTEAATQGSVEDMRKLIHWYQTNQGTSANAEHLKKWKAKEEFVSWNDSMFALGNRYYWTSEEKDRTRGFDRHLALANQGDAYAQLWIGDCYFFGRGVAKNHEEAVKWYKKSAEQGYAEAQYWLGYCYASGFGVEMNSAMSNFWWEKALRWFKRAAERGYSKEQTMLGECYFWGYGVPQNRVTAVSWFRKAAEKGYADAQYWLGICYSSGQGVEKNPAEVIKWYYEAARSGHAGARARYRDMG